MKYWEIVADNLKKAGWSLGWVSALNSRGRTIWIADARREGKRFVARADEKLTAFLETRIGDSAWEIRCPAQHTSRKPSRTANISARHM
jgi:hypothetical protein